MDLAEQDQLSEPAAPTQRSEPPRASWSPHARRASYLLAALVVASMAFRALGDATVGVADNGDGFRVMDPAGLAHVLPLDDHRFRSVQRTYRLGPTRFVEHPSSGAAIACVARWVPFFTQGTPATPATPATPGIPATPATPATPGRFDLRQLALVYLVLVGGALAAAFAFRTPGWIVVGVAATLASPFYADWFSSFYGDAAALLGLAIVTLALVENERDTRAAEPWRYVLLVVGAALVGFSSRAHAWVPAATLAVASAKFLVVRRDTSSRGSRAAWLGASALLTVAVAAPLHFERGRGYRFPEINRFHAVYRGIADLADDGGHVLDELGLPAASRARIGRSYFRDPVDPQLDRALARAGPGALAPLWARRPQAMRRALELASRALAGDLPITLSHGPTSPRAFARFEEPRPSLHRFRETWVDARAPFFVILLTTTVTVVSSHGRSIRAAFALLVAVVAGEIVVSLLGDGTFSLARHLLLASFAFDLALVLGVGVMIVDIATWIRTRVLRGRNWRRA